MPRARKAAASPEAKPILSYDHPEAGRSNLPTVDSADTLIPPNQDAPEQLTEKDTSTPPPTRNECSEKVSFPHLTWQGKTPEIHEHRHGPLYVHDKVSPVEILSRLMLRSTDRQMGLFADAREAFNGFKREDGSLAANAANEPYRYHNGHWANRLIRATAQRAMRSLLYREGMAGQVSLVYLDPPYNNSFRSNFAPAANDFDIKDNEKGVPNDPLSIQAYRDTYENGIHSYLDGLKEQLELAKQLLAEDGSIIVQIGPDSLHYVALLLSQVFDPKNHVATIPFITNANSSTSLLPEITNWLVWYAKDKSKTSNKYHQVYANLSNRKELLEQWESGVRIEYPSGERRNLPKKQRDNPESIPPGRLYTTYPAHAQHESGTGRSDTYYYHPDGKPCPVSGGRWPSKCSSADHKHSKDEECQYPHPEEWSKHTCSPSCDQAGTTRLCPKGRRCGPKCQANAYPCPKDRQWSVSLRGLHSIAQAGRLQIGEKGGVRWIQFEDEVPGVTLNAMWQRVGVIPEKQYPVETPPRVLERVILMTTDPGDLVLDLTCGSGAMPYQCETWGRRWMSIDVSAVSIAIARDRILTGSYPCHLLKDSLEGHRKDHELSQAMLGTNEPFQPQAVYGNDPAQGFVNERQIRVSAATLAYGPKIPQDIIYHPDRTHKDNRLLRAASNFEVCSDSPDRAVSPEQIAAQASRAAADLSQVQGEEIENALPRHTLELEPLQVRVAANLTSSGISQNGRHRYRVKNLHSTLIPGLTHTAIIVDEADAEHPAGFYLGKADEIISSTKTRDAAYHAGNNGFRYLGVVGFAQDGDAGKAGESFPNVTVLNIIANRDLQLDHLKDAKRDNGFVIISEPEVRLHRRGATPDGTELVALEVIGINAFDPKRGVVDEPSARHIKAIIVDSAYDGKKFVASHYNIRPTKQNQRAFKELTAAYKGTIDDAAWQQMQTCETVPFPLPEGDDKIAVKVIDQTGAEHLKVIQDPRAAAGVAKSTRPRAKGRRGRKT